VGVVLVKPGVQFLRIAPAGFRILAAIDTAADTVGVDLTITSASEARGRELANPHRSGEAFDLSVLGLSLPQIKQVKDLIADVLNGADGDAFTVLYEIPPSGHMLMPPLPWATVNQHATAAHLHIQRRKDTVFPRATTT